MVIFCKRVLDKYLSQTKDYTGYMKFRIKIYTLAVEWLLPHLFSSLTQIIANIFWIFTQYYMDMEMLHESTKVLKYFLIIAWVSRCSSHNSFTLWQNISVSWTLWINCALRLSLTPVESNSTLLISCIAKLLGSIMVPEVTRNQCRVRVSG